MRFTLTLAAAFWLFLSIFSCTSSTETLNAKLQEIGRTDLQDIIKELKEQGKQGIISGNPSFVVHEYEEFHGDTARVFQANATLYFFYLNSVDLCQMRKYRFRTMSKIWDRYEVRVVHIPPKYLGDGKN